MRGHLPDAPGAAAARPGQALALYSVRPGPDCRRAAAGAATTVTADKEFEGVIDRHPKKEYQWELDRKRQAVGSSDVSERHLFKLTYKRSGVKRQHEASFFTEAGLRAYMSLHGITPADVKGMQ